MAIHAVERHMTTLTEFMLSTVKPGQRLKNAIIPDITFNY